MSKRTIAHILKAVIVQSRKVKAVGEIVVLMLILATPAIKTNPLLRIT
jgi:sporulation protein YlmC with PRC-barrel domain